MKTKVRSKRTKSHLPADATVEAGKAQARSHVMDHVHQDLRHRQARKSLLMLIGLDLLTLGTAWLVIRYLPRRSR